MRGSTGARAFVLAFTSPDFTSRAGDIWSGMVESIVMTIAASVVGIAISIPIGLGAARNIAPLPVYLVCRAIVAVSRAMQEIIVAILLVAIFGFGPLAGFLTLSFATIGFLSKLLAEDIEAMDRVQAEAIRASGARWLQIINYGVQPQVMPRLIGLSMYRIDINFRESAILGLVGAGRHRRHAQHRLRPLRVRHGGRHPAHHHRHRDGARVPVRRHPRAGAVMGAR